MFLLLLGLSIAPVIFLLVFIYRKDKYEKEPIGLLLLTFLGGMLAIPLDLAIVSLLNNIYVSDSVFYSAFLEAGLCEEVSKFIILFLLIWWNKNFNEHMDGIVYAAYVGLGFACVENIMYVLQAGSANLASGIGTGIIRALLSVPGHFLFAVLMGYFFSLTKFSEKGWIGYFMASLLVPTLAHGLFDYLLMINDVINPVLGVIILALFIWGDIKLWKLCVKYIRKHQEESPFKDPNPIDWNAGNSY